MFDAIQRWLDAQKQYDVLVSYASEDRPYVGAVAHSVREKRVKIYYDQFEKAESWGKCIKKFLADLYKHRGLYCVVFASEKYAKKEWPTYELRHAIERAAEEKSEYVLVARFDGAVLPGVEVSEKIYIDLGEKPEFKVKPEELANNIVEKVKTLKRGRRRRIAAAVAAVLPFFVPAGYAVREFIEPDPTIQFSTDVSKETLKVSITNPLSRPLDIAGIQVLFKNVPIVKTELVRADVTPLHIRANDHVDLVLKTNEYRLDTLCNDEESRHFVRLEIEDKLAGGQAILKIRTHDPSNPFWTPTWRSDPIRADSLSDFVLPRIPTRAPRTCS